MDVNAIAADILFPEDRRTKPLSEDAVAGIEQLSSAAISAIVEKLASHTRVGVGVNLPDSNLAVLATHLTRLLPLAEPLKLPALLAPWEPLILETLCCTPNLPLARILHNLTVIAVRADRHFHHTVLNRYIVATSDSRFSRVGDEEVRMCALLAARLQEALIDAASRSSADARKLGDGLVGCLAEMGASPAALHLILSIAESQLPHLREIVIGAGVFNMVVDVLRAALDHQDDHLDVGHTARAHHDHSGPVGKQNHSDDAMQGVEELGLVMSLWVLALLLPTMAPAISAESEIALMDLLAVLKLLIHKLGLSRTMAPCAHQALQAYIQTLYGMYPASVFSFLRSEAIADASFRSSVAPFLAVLPVHHTLLADPAEPKALEEEQSPQRWHDADPHEVFASLRLEQADLAPPLHCSAWPQYQAAASRGGDEAASIVAVQAQELMMRAEIGPEGEASQEEVRGTVGFSGATEVHSGCAELHQLALQSELIYERYVGKMHVRRCRRLHKEASCVQDARAEVSSCMEDMERVRHELVACRAQLHMERARAQQQQATAAESQSQVEAVLRDAETHRAELQGEKCMLQKASSALYEQLQNVNEHLEQREMVSFEHFAQEDTMDTLRQERDKLRTCVQKQEYQLAMWEMHHRQQTEADKARSRSSQGVLDAMQGHSDAVDHVSHQLQHSQLTCAMLHDRATELEKERARFEKDAQTLLQLLETQKVSAKAQVDAMAQKYASVKRICTHLESECLNLHAQVK